MLLIRDILYVQMFYFFQLEFQVVERNSSEKDKLLKEWNRYSAKYFILTDTALPEVT